MSVAGWSLVSRRRTDRRRASPPAAHEDDRELVARMLAGDEAAVDSFGERFGAAVYRFAVARLGGERDVARDVVQTTFAKALARLDSYRGEAALLTWLCSCCRNEVLMHRRRAQSGIRATTVEPTLLEAVPDATREANAEAVLLDEERSERVHLTLDSLPEHYAQALEWKYVDQLPVETIAERLGLGLKAAESLLVRARRSFRNTFENFARGTPGTAGAVRAGTVGSEP
jgi:RNA polymerase sigma-70 factor, ECF subfamily